MASNDRSVNLGELASRTRSGGSSAGRRRDACRNPECQNGLTPGLTAVGGGKTSAPLFGPGGVGANRLMRWAWVPCLACNAPDDARRAGAVYKHLNLSDGEIARRAQLANTKAAYKPAEKELAQTTLGRAGQPVHTAQPRDDGKLAELLEQNKQLNARIEEMLKQNASMTDTLSRMTMQVASLLEDNAKLREQLSKPASQLSRAIDARAKAAQEDLRGTLGAPSVKMERPTLHLPEKDTP